MLASAHRYALLLLLSLLTRQGIAQTLTIDAALDFSHATALTAAPVGDRVAWVSHHRGVRNVWVAKGPQWIGRMVTTYAADDGQAIAELAFTPDAESVLFVRGGRANRQGGDRLWWGAGERIVFPWEKTGWLHLWSIAASGGEPVDLTPGEGEGQHAQLTPDGHAMGVPDVGCASPRTRRGTGRQRASDAWQPPRAMNSPRADRRETPT